MRAITSKSNAPHLSKSSSLSKECRAIDARARVDLGLLFRYCMGPNPDAIDNFSFKSALHKSRKCQRVTFVRPQPTSN